MKDIHYAFCVARIRALENKILTKQDILSLIEHNSYASALSFLVQKGYFNDNEDADNAIIRHGNELHTLLSESVPDKSQLDALYILNDYFNLKALVKCAVEETDSTSFFLHPTGIKSCDFSISKEISEFDFLNDEYRSVAQRAYSIAVKSNNGKFADVVVDRAAIDALSSHYKKRNSGMLGEICAFLGDTANIKIALRCAVTNQDAEYISEAIGECNRLDRSKLIQCTTKGMDELTSYLLATDYKNGVETYLNKPSAFEKWCDDEIVSITKAAAYTSFGFSPVVSYFYKKSFEIKTVRMILSAIKSYIDKDIIKERVREYYA